MRGVVLETGRRLPPRLMTPAEAQRLARRDSALLARLDQPVHLYRTVARGAGTVRHHAEASDLCPHRRPRGRSHRRTPRTDRRGT